jgi:integrase
MSRQHFRSDLASEMDAFVAFKRSQGYDYRHGICALRHFDHFLLRWGYAGPELTHDILSRYAASVRHLAPNTQYGRLAAARVFARWLRRLIPGSAVIENPGVKRPTLPRYYLYSQAELASLIQAARQMDETRSGTRQPRCLATLVGLLYVTGLRIGEALALDVGDIDLAAGRLTVRLGKLGKSRNVALSTSAVAALGRFLDTSFDWGSTGRDAPLFLHTRGGRLGYSSVSESFRTLLRRCEIGTGARQSPRLHDLRHSFACDCLRKWYAEGVDVNVKLPILSTAMGHVHINDTQIYLHVTAQLLQVAADRFHETFTNNSKGAQ